MSHLTAAPLSPLCPGSVPLIPCESNQSKLACCSLSLSDGITRHLGEALATHCNSPSHLQPGADEGRGPLSLSLLSPFLLFSRSLSPTHTLWQSLSVYQSFFLTFSRFFAVAICLSVSFSLSPSPSPSLPSSSCSHRISQTNNSVTVYLTCQGVWEREGRKKKRSKVHYSLDSGYSAHLHPDQPHICLWISFWGNIIGRAV